MAADDPRFIRHLRAGRKRAFNELVLGFKDRVFNTAYRFLGDWQEANDLAQDVFISVNKNIRSFRAQSSLSTWIYRITVNMCKNRFKSGEFSRKRSTVGLDDAQGAQNLRSRDMPHRLFEKKELELSVQAAIIALPEEWKEIVLLRDIEGLPYCQIAEILGIEEGTVKSRLSRARLALKDRLEGVINA